MIIAEPTCLVDCAATLGEGPIWVDRERALYWVDIKGPTIFRWTESSGEVKRWTPPLRVGSLAPHCAGGFIGGTEHGFARINLDAGRYELVHDPEPHYPDNRFNDGKVDRRGRFWAGTMDDREQEATGSLYRMDADGSVASIDSGYRVTNGPAFSVDGSRMYHSDSAAQTIFAFDLAPDGSTANKRVFAQFGEGDGYPDGMTVDAEDCLWVAFWDGWCIRRFAPDGSRIAEVKMPVQRPTSCAFGGEKLDQLFVTSARIGFDAAALRNQPQAGGLFRLKPGVKGIAERPFG